jgi:hypothetical protein
LLRARHPDATPAAIREAIVRSSRAAPGHLAGVHSDEFGTGLLDPVAAAAYLVQHPGGTIPRRTGSSGTVGPDTIVAGYVGADHKIMLATASGGKIPVAGVTSADRPAARVVFSRDGAWFAAADGRHLAIVNVQSRRQEALPCTCHGVAFNDKGQLLTADGNVLAVYEPATASRLRGTAVRNTSGVGVPSFMELTVEGVSGELTIVNGRFASAGYGAFAIRPDGTTVLLGRGPDPGVTTIAVSDDGRWVAWSMYGVCNQQSQLGIADLSHLGASANITGASAQGEALQIQFDGDNVLAAWAPMQHGRYGCTDPAWPPAQWQLARPAMGTGTDAQPATATWSKVADPRTVLHRWPSGEGLYLQPAKAVRQYELTFGPAPGGAGPVPLGSQVLDAVARPDGSAPTQPPATTQPPAPPATTSSAPTTPSGSPASADAAIARYEKFLHALGNSDATTICEIAGPAMKKAEAEGIGPCPSAWHVVFQMISPAQKAALRTATVDRARIATRTATKIDIPAAAIKASVTFTSGDLGDSTLEYQHGQWYITD